MMVKEISMDKRKYIRITLFSIYNKAPFVCRKVVSFWKVNSGESEFRESEFRESVFRCLVV